MKSLTLLVPFYQASDELADGFLDRLLTMASEVERAEVTVCTLDDASSDDTLERLLPYRTHPNLDVLEHTRNTDYDGAMNDLLRFAFDRHDPDWLLFFSQDANMEAAAIDRLLAFLEADPNLGILQPLVEDKADGVYSLGHRYNDYYMCHPIQRRHPVREPWNPDEPVRRPSVSLLGTIVRREVFDDIGGLDERFEHYWESSDLCFRGCRAGWDIAVTTESVATHDRYLSESTPDQLYYSYRNWPLFWAKYDGRISELILDEYWPTSGSEVGKITEDVSGVSDTEFLERARNDANERLEAFTTQLHFPLDAIDTDRMIHHE